MRFPCFLFAGRNIRRPVFRKRFPATHSGIGRARIPTGTRIAIPVCGRNIIRIVRDVRMNKTADGVMLDMS